MRVVSTPRRCPDHASYLVLSATGIHVLSMQPAPYLLRSPRHVKETSSPLSTPHSRAPHTAIAEHRLLPPTHWAAAPRVPKQPPPLMHVLVSQCPPPSPAPKLVPCSATPSFPISPLRAGPRCTPPAQRPPVSLSLCVSSPRVESRPRQAVRRKGA
jgi:hypothetical protein